MKLRKQTVRDGLKRLNCMEERMMEVVMVPVKELKKNEKNPRRITKSELNKLARSIKEFGFVDPIIVNKNKTRYNVVVGGHQRLDAAMRILNMNEVPVTYVDLPEDKEHLLNLALNEIGGEWDDQKLLDLLKDLENKGVDLTLTGFDEPIIDEILAREDAVKKNEAIDVAPAVPDVPKSKLGEVWKLGGHRLMCGDSTSKQDFKKLMNEQLADGCWTDPPYGVSYKGTNNPDGKDWGVLKNDELRGMDLYQFLLPIYKNVFQACKEGTVLYTCYASVNHTIFENALNEAGFEVKQQLIWEKGHVLGHSDYHWCHESILYCKKKEDKTSWYGDRTHKTVILNSTVEDLEGLKKEELIELLQKVRQASDLLSEKKDPTTSYLHSTQKPVSLSARMIKNSTRPGEVVIDPCAGSGSTLMACELSGRKCYCMEISEKYVDVIIQRYVDFTGKPESVFRENPDGTKTPYKEIFG